MFFAKRFATREVKVGSVGIGGLNPIRIQSMTTTNTRDVEATGEQILRLADVGCEIVRVTVQGKKEAEALEGIKNYLAHRGCFLPLVADIHFYPPAALLAAEFADKIRINPGNFVDRRATFKVIEYDEALYAQELLKIEETFLPFVEKCKRLQRAIRIGTNHGSLSDRIMNRYGDTPRGMVESALEFARIGRRANYHGFIFSMKASHPAIMIEAYRLLHQEMENLGWDYPLHLGVTEAGEGEEGRVKSAMGIGALLLEGLGDTIRISLTEDPCDEIDPCRRLIRFCETGRSVSVFGSVEQTSLVVLRVSEKDMALAAFFEDIGCDMRSGSPIKTMQSADCLWVDAIEEERREALRALGISVCTSQEEMPSGVLVETFPCAEEDLAIQAAAAMGSALCDKKARGVCLLGNQPLSVRRRISFQLLQAARLRMVKTDFISCPGCGRTLFDLQETSRRIREKTNHLPGVKIAIMGCVVNGPGEMADADFGYVGSKPGKIDLYLGKKCVERDIAFAEADARLIALIQCEGKWIEPPGKFSLNLCEP